MRTILQVGGHGEAHTWLPCKSKIFSFDRLARQQMFRILSSDGMKNKCISVSDSCLVSMRVMSKAEGKKRLTKGILYASVKQEFKYVCKTQMFAALTH